MTKEKIFKPINVELNSKEYSKVLESRYYQNHKSLIILAGIYALIAIIGFLLILQSVTIITKGDYGVPEGIQFVEVDSKGLNANDYTLNRHENNYNEDTVLIGTWLLFVGLVLALVTYFIMMIKFIKYKNEKLDEYIIEKIEKNSHA